MTEETNLSKRHNDPLLQRIHDDLTEMKAIQAEQKVTLDEMKDILVVWNNTKGFINTVRFLGTTLKWIALVGGSIAAVLYWFKDFITYLTRH